MLKSIIFFALFAWFAESRIQNPGDPEPLFNPATDIHFMLFTRDNPTNPQFLGFDVDNIRNSWFRKNRRIRFLIHGWNSHGNTSFNRESASSFFQIDDMNVISVDWRVGANTINYVTARGRVNVVAERLASFIEFLSSNEFITKSDQINIIGHSLGAHIAGIVGKLLRSVRLHVIFGLDPAGALFDRTNPDTRLARDDADHTVVIHTNAGQLGFAEPLAKVDFYPNGGIRQPGCGLDISGSCSHSRSHQIYVESILSDRFVAIKCLNYQDLREDGCTDTGIREILTGEKVQSDIKEGIYFFRTNSQRPFGLGPV